MFLIEIKTDVLGVKIEIEIRLKYMLIEIKKKKPWKILRVWYWYKKKIKSLWCL